MANDLEPHLSEVKLPNFRISCHKSWVLNGLQVCGSPGEGVMDSDLRRDFEAFVNEIEPRLRRALIATYGFQLGREATADALGWAWEHWDRLDRITNKVAYLYRVGQSTTRRRKLPITFERNELSEP